MTQISTADAPAATRTLTVVVPVYNEQENLAELCRRVKEACDSVPDLTWSMIMVDDGSKDDTAKLALEQHAADPRFNLVKLSRNFGHQAAITAGLSHADGDAVVIMAQRKSRAETGLRRVGFDLFHKFFRWLSDFPIPSQTGVFGLMDRAAHEELVKLTERNRFIPGLRAWIGFDQRTVYYDRQERAAGEPKQTFKRLIKYAMDGVFSFSYKPLRLMMWAGVMVSMMSFLVAIYFIIKRIAGAETSQTGFTTTITLILFLGGIQLIAIGLLGEYLGRIYDEVKNRPMFIVKSFTGKQK